MFLRQTRACLYPTLVWRMFTTSSIKFTPTYGKNNPACGQHLDERHVSLWSEISAWRLEHGVVVVVGRWFLSWRSSICNESDALECASLRVAATLLLLSRRLDEHSTTACKSTCRNNVHFRAQRHRYWCTDVEWSVLIIFLHVCTKCVCVMCVYVVLMSRCTTRESKQIE